MRAGGPGRTVAPVQVLMDIRRDGDGRVIGQVTPLGGAPVRFSGWLELLHLLEDHADEIIPEEGTET
jgi:hypothetical protein